MPIYNLLGLDVFIPDWNDLVSAVTTPLANVVNDVLRSISDAVWPLLQNLGSSIYVLFQPFLDRLWQGILDVGHVVSSALGPFVDWIVQHIQGFFADTWSIIERTYNAYVTMINIGLAPIVNRLNTLGAEIWADVMHGAELIKTWENVTWMPTLMKTSSDVLWLNDQFGVQIPNLQQQLLTTGAKVDQNSGILMSLPIEMEKILAAKINEIFNPLATLAEDIWKTFVDVIVKPIQALIASAAGVFDSWVRSFGDAMTNTLGNIAAGGPEEAPGRAMTLAFTLGPLITGINVAAQAIELLHPIKQMGIVQTVTSILDSLGVTAFSSAMYGLLVMGSVQAPIRQGLAYKFRHGLPPGQISDTMLFQQTITQQAWERSYGLRGWSDQYIQAWREAMYAEPSDRMIVGMVEGGSIDNDWLLDKLLKRRYRPADAARIMRYATRKALANEIAAIVSEVQADLLAGQIDMQDARQELTDIGMSGSELEFRVNAMNRRMTRKDVNDKIDILTSQAKQEELTLDAYERELISLGLRIPRVRALVEKETARRKPKTGATEEKKRDLAIGTYQRLFIEGTIPTIAQLDRYLTELKPPLPRDRIDLLITDAQIRQAKAETAAA